MTTIKDKIHEFISLIRLMKPAGKLRVGLLALDMLLILLLLGMTFQYLTLTYFLVSLITVIVYIIGLLWHTFMIK